jgi:hypothetical protein
VDRTCGRRPGAHDENGELPIGYGAALVRHFYRRSQQLAPIKRSIECRFALVELALSASLANGWMKSPLTLTTKDDASGCGDLRPRLGRYAGPSGQS